MVTTPTNEAGHGLPELPALPSLECGSDTGHLAIHTEDQIRRYAESYGRACYALALSRGVPEGWKLVPVEPTREMVEAGVMFGNSPNKASMIYQNMVHAAPAAAGAQGEDEIDRAARRMGDSARSLLQDIAQQATPQPAAADGGVRERARALFDAMLAAPYGSTTMGDIVCAETTCNRLESAWLPILEAALSSHRQAGDVAVDLLRELRTARPLLLYGDAWIERIDSFLALVEKGAGNG